MIHRQNTVTPIPRPLKRVGKISDNINHVTGEIEPCWKARNVTVNESTTYGRAVVPSSVCEKIPIRRSDVVVPNNPVNPPNANVTIH